MSDTEAPPPGPLPDLFGVTTPPTNGRRRRQQPTRPIVVPTPTPAAPDPRLFTVQMDDHYLQRLLMAFSLLILALVFGPKFKFFDTEIPIQVAIAALAIGTTYYAAQALWECYQVARNHPGPEDAPRKKRRQTTVGRAYCVRARTVLYAMLAIGLWLPTPWAYQPTLKAYKQIESFFMTRHPLEPPPAPKPKPAPAKPKEQSFIEELFGDTPPQRDPSRKN